MKIYLYPTVVVVACARLPRKKLQEVVKKRINIPFLPKASSVEKISSVLVTTPR